MTPGQEIEKIKREYKEHWSFLENFPIIRQAISENNPIKLGEEAAKIVYGNVVKPTEEELAAAEYEKYLAYMRERLVEQRKRISN